MTPEENKAIIRNYFENYNKNPEEVLKKTGLKLRPSIYNGPVSDDFYAKHEGADSAWFTAFPDFKYYLQEIIGEGDTVVTRWLLVGTQTGKLWGLPPTGKKITISGLSMYHFIGGKQVEMWERWDTIGLLEQLDVKVPIEKPEKTEKQNTTIKS
jgi:predicted ester cyclase